MLIFSTFSGLVCGFANRSVLAFVRSRV